ncbi:MAG: hypothetical protein GY862_25885 [Gammaproteobacteria bacterium]|nr:hypothetical protein [Gammaproteobacteria bacterium]
MAKNEEQKLREGDTTYDAATGIMHIPLLVVGELPSSIQWYEVDCQLLISEAGDIEFAVTNIIRIPVR